jgi:hypothetical protein
MSMMESRITLISHLELLCFADDDNAALRPKSREGWEVRLQFTGLT